MAARLAVTKAELEKLLEAHEVSRGLEVRLRGKHLTLSRQVETFGGGTEPDDRVRLTELGGNRFGLSVMRHTGKWERAPFSGTLEEMVEVICSAMQHLIAEWP